MRRVTDCGAGKAVMHFHWENASRPIAAVDIRDPITIATHGAGSL
jgi:hypothetical protein